MSSYSALVVSETANAGFSSSVQECASDDLPPGEVLIRVHYSSVNYKDALSAAGNKAVTRHYPHTPGIDAAGEVLESSSAQFAVGDEVIVTGYDLGMNTPGGFGQCIRVPAGWIVRKPEGLSLRASMELGTAGFTAARCVQKLQALALDSTRGEILVTGATGGVGCLSVALLSKLGYTVVASTGKAGARDWLLELGASSVIGRDELQEPVDKPLLKPRWAGAIDCVGGETLANVLKSVAPEGAVAACGLVQSADLPTSVFPFILRGVNLLGVDSVELPLSVKQQLWNRLASDWRLEGVSGWTTEIGLNDLAQSLQTVLAGRAQGRFLVNLAL